MTRVFGIQEPRPIFDRSSGQSIARDFSSAQRYGRVDFILDQKDSPSNAPSPCLMKLVRGFRDFTQEDYILYAGGDPLGLFLASSALNHYGFKDIQFLRWDRERARDGSKPRGVGFYVPITVNLRP